MIIAVLGFFGALFRSVFILLIDQAKLSRELSGIFFPHSAGGDAGLFGGVEQSRIDFSSRHTVVGTVQCEPRPAVAG